MQFLYNIAAILVVILIIPVFMIRSVREKGDLKQDCVYVGKRQRGS